MEHIKYFREQTVTYLEPLKKNSLDLFLCYCGYEQCRPGYGFGPAVRSEYLIHQILEGEGTYHVNGEVYHLKKNQGFLILPGEITYYEANQDHPWHYIWIAVNGMKASHYLNYANLNEQKLIFNFEDDERLKNYVFQMLEIDSYTYANELKLQALIYQFFSALIEVNHEVVSPYKTKGSEIYLEQSIQYIHSNYANPIKVCDIAEFIGINRSYLTNIFKEKLNTSPQEYLLNHRLTIACEVLTQTNLPIADIAKGVGYNDPFAFSKIFRKHKCMSPSQFRAQKNLDD